MTLVWVYIYVLIKSFQELFLTMLKFKNIYILGKITEARFELWGYRRRKVLGEN